MGVIRDFEYELVPHQSPYRVANREDERDFWLPTGGGGGLSEYLCVDEDLVYGLPSSVSRKYLDVASRDCDL